VIEIAARWEENGARIPIKLTEMPLVLVGECRDLVISKDSPIPTPKDELASGEIP
jgi:hypothetical protein